MQQISKLAYALCIRLLVHIKLHQSHMQAPMKDLFFIRQLLHEHFNAQLSWPCFNSSRLCCLCIDHEFFDLQLLVRAKVSQQEPFRAQKP